MVLPSFCPSVDHNFPHEKRESISTWPTSRQPLLRATPSRSCYISEHRFLSSPASSTNLTSTLTSVRALFTHIISLLFLELIHINIDVISRIPYEAMNKPELFSCKSSSLADINNRRQLAKYSSESSEEKFDGHGAHSRRASRSHSSKWSLRRRNSSDRSSQPHSAPSGPDAQHSENFKKFYKAVTSPTHIRVTAGGRIVPNTRAAPPPAFEWNAEEHHFNQNNTLSEQE